MLRHGFWRPSPAAMTNHSQPPSAIPAAERIGLPGSSARMKTIRPDGWVYLYARLALGAAFLSAVASRFGLWDRTLDLKHFAKFLIHGGSELVHAPSHYPAPRVGGDGCRDIAGNLADIRMVVAMGLARERRSAGDVRDSDGDFLWAQIADGLLGVLGFGRGGLAGAASVQTAPATVLPKSNVRTVTMMRPPKSDHERLSWRNDRYSR